MRRTLSSLAELLGGTVRGDGAREVCRLSTLEDAGPEDLSFLHGSRYLEQAARSAAGALLVAPAVVDKLPQDLIVVEDPYLGLARLLSSFDRRRERAAGRHPTAEVAASAEVDSSARLGPFAVVGRGARIGAGASIGAHCVIGDDCRVGRDTVLHARVTLYAESVVGERCILHSGVVIGGDGFGFATAAGEHHKLEHLGRAVLEDDVEVGANSAIDRGLLGETRIGAGSKIDDLVMVGHNVRIGRGCLLVAQAGIAGSAQLGDGVVVAGQSGIIGHVKVGDGVVVATKSAVLKPVADGEQVAGIPATSLSKWRRQQALIGRLADLRSRLLRLERESRQAVADSGGRLDGEERT